MDNEFIEAINATADTSFDPRIAKRPSGSTKTAFWSGERDKRGPPFETTPHKCPPYLGKPSGRVPNDEEKRGARHLENEYLAGRLGKNEAENGRLWNTVKWIAHHNRIATLPSEALPPFNNYVPDAIAQDTGAPIGFDDEAPDEKQENEGVEFQCINVGEADSPNSMKVMDDDGVTHRLEIKVDDYDVLRLADQLDECDETSEIDASELVRKNLPLPERTDFPSDPNDFIESGKIIRILMLGMRTLWTPVIRAIEDGVTMNSLGKSQGVGDDKAATVGRWRVIEGLRLAESIRRGLERQRLRPQKPMPARSKIPSVKDMMPLLATPRSVHASSGHYLNQAAGPVIKRADNPLAANDNDRLDTVALSAA